MSGHAVLTLVKLPLTFWGVWPAGIEHLCPFLSPPLLPQ